MLERRVVSPPCLRKSSLRNCRSCESRSTYSALFPLIFELDKPPSIVSSLRPVGLELFRRRGLITDQTRLAFVLYDWLINLDEEIRCFWNVRKDRRPTAAAVFYVLLRYPPIIHEFLGVPTLFPMTETVCPLDFFSRSRLQNAH